MVGAGERDGQAIGGVQSRESVHTRRRWEDDYSVQAAVSGGLGGVFEGKSGRG